MNETPKKDYSKEMPIVKYWYRSIIDSKHILDVFSDGHVEAAVIEDRKEDSFLDGAGTIEPSRVESLAKRLFEAMENLQYPLCGGGEPYDDEVDIQVFYQGQSRGYSWSPPSQKAPAQLEEFVHELEGMHQSIPKKRIQ